VKSSYEACQAAAIAVSDLIICRDGEKFAESLVVEEERSGCSQPMENVGNKRLFEHSHGNHPRSWRYNEIRGGS
jgi:hypothetical protein